MLGQKGLKERNRGRGCHSKTRMSNKNSTSSLGITSSYLYKVSTKLSYVNLWKYLWSTPISCHSHVNCLPCHVSMYVHHTDVLMSVVHCLYLPRGVTANSHGRPSMTASVSWCQKACPRRIITEHLWVKLIFIFRPCLSNLPVHSLFLIISPVLRLQTFTQFYLE